MLISGIDSIPYFLDLGANVVITNDTKLMTIFKLLNIRLKGVGFLPATTQGTGCITTPLKYGCVALDNIPVQNFSSVPRSPYNLLPHQLMKAEYGVKHSEKYDSKYLLQYQSLTNIKANFQVGS